jgi:hypothetical protein
MPQFQVMFLSSEQGNAGSVQSHGLQCRGSRGICAAKMKGKWDRLRGPIGVGLRCAKGASGGLLDRLLFQETQPAASRQFRLFEHEISLTLSYL